MSNIQLQCLLGIQCQDFAMIAADQTNIHSVLVMKDDEEKIFQISENLILGVNGDQGSAEQFSQYIAKNIHLYKMRNRYQLSTSAAVHFTRRNMAECLRTGTPYTVNLLIAGYDEKDGGQLYYLDHLASCAKVPYASHGYGGLLSLGILDYLHRQDLTETAAYEIMKECVAEVQRRLLINLANFQVTTVNKHGVKILPGIRCGVA